MCLMLPVLTLSFLRYVSRVKWSNSGNGVATSVTPWCISFWKGACRSSLTTVANFSYSYLNTHICMMDYIYIYIYIITYRQSVSLYHSSSACLDTRDSSSWDQKLPNFTSLQKHSSRPNASKGILRICINFRWFIFYAIRYRCAPFVWRALHYASGDIYM